MENRKRYEKCKAFTLVEILIVVIIIGILAGLMALSFGSSTETAERTACLGDRRTIKSAYYVERAENGKAFKDSLEEAMEQFTKGSQLAIANDRAVYGGICHAGGLYTIITIDDKLVILCSVSGHNENRDNLSSNEIYDRIVEQLESLKQGTSNGYVHGDTLMNAVKELIASVYQYNGQMYYFKVDVKFGENPMLFAGTKAPSGKEKYGAEYFYDSRNKTWYKCSSTLYTSDANLRLDAIYQCIQNNKPYINSNGEEIFFTSDNGFNPNI